MDDKNKENELIDASSSPLFQLANETKEEEEQINNDFIAKKQNETNITNSEVNQMFNKGTVANPEVVEKNQNTFTNEEAQLTPNNAESQNTFTNPEEHKAFFDQTIPDNGPVEPSVEQPLESPKNNNESNPMLGIVMLIILFLCVGGIAFYNVFLKDSGETKHTASSTATEQEKKEETPIEEEQPKQEEPKQEETKKEESAEEVTTTMVCKGATHDYGITINITATVVFKNNELYTIEVYEKSNSLNKDIIDLVAKAAYVGGYSYSTTSDYKSITMKGTKNTLSKSVKDEIGTKDKAENYYKKLGLICNT
jgi:hypothetical protein